MSRIKKLTVLSLLLAVGPGSALAQGGVAGVANMASSKKSSAASKRYSNIAGKVGEPKKGGAVVWLEGDFSSVTNAVADTVEVGQKDFQFSLSTLAIPVGTKVTFPNHDDAYHNVFSYSKTKRFDLGRYLKDESPPAVLFDKPGIVKLYCEIHEHMSATIVVVDSPFFTTSDAEGKFSLSGVPAGKYTLKAWLGKRTIVERAVEIQNGQTATVELSAK